MHRKRIRYATLGLLVGFVLSACGGGGPKGVTPQKYVAGVCGSVLDWVDSLKSRSSALESQSASVTSLEEGKRLFVDYFDGVVWETNAMIASVQAMGAPAVDQGEQLHNRLLQALQKIRSSLVSAAAKAKELPTDDPNAFQQETTQIGSSIESELSSVADPLKDAKNAELDAAAKANPDCQKLESL